MSGITGSLIVEGRLSRDALKMLRKTLKSTLQAPYNELILVEHNGDGSVYYFVKGWAREYRIEVDKLQTRGPASAAVQALLKRFLTDYNQEWLLLVKGFLELSPGWWVEASTHAEKEDTGMVWGVVWTKRELDAGCPSDAACLQGKLRRFECLGGLDDVILRRKAITDLWIPGHVRHYIDAWVTWWLRCRGWRVEIIRKGAVLLKGHTSGKPAESIYEAYRLGILEECNPPARESLKSTLRPIASFIAGLASYTVTRIVTGLLRIRGLHNSTTNSMPTDKLRLLLARLKYGPPRHPCDLVFNTNERTHFRTLTKPY